MKDQHNRNITYLRLSVTDRCNLRCRYCMPETGVPKKQHDDILSIEEAVQATEIAADLGVRKVRITGGEPLLKKGIDHLCRSISAIPGIEEVCMTTNGILLPKYGQAIVDAGVSRINLSLDTLNQRKYQYITRWGAFEDAWKGVQEALRLGFSQVKINTVLMGGFNDDEIGDFVHLTRELPLDVRFIELMPIGESASSHESVFVDCDLVTKRVPELRPLHQQEGVSRLYQLPGARGRVGLISALSHDFCNRCDKIRLTADGKLKPCLHSGQEINLRGLSKAGKRQAMKEAILGKPQKREEIKANTPSKAGRPMNRIGG